MKTNKISLSITIFMVAASLIFTDCRKRETTDPIEPDNESASAADNNLAEGSSNDILSIGSQLSENSGTLTTYKSSNGSSGEMMLVASCATIASNATTLMPVATMFTVDFGTSGCTGLDSRVRKGKLFFDFSQSATGADAYRKPGFKMIVTSSNYSVDDNQIFISNKTITNTSPASIAGEAAYSGTNLTWNITVSNMQIVKANGEGTFIWNCNRNKELINSNDPLCYKGQDEQIDWTKAKVKLNGTAGGTNTKGESFTAEARDLERHFTCTPNSGQPHRHPFVKGTVDYKPGNRAVRHINYGNGECDFNATITINGQTFTLSVN